MCDTVESVSVGDAAQTGNCGPWTGSAPRQSGVVGRALGFKARRYENLLLLIVLAIQTVFSLLLASREPFSVDEYLVRLTALSGSPTAVWHLLKTAPLTVDPPLYHFLIVYWIRIFGPSEFSCRLPSVLAYTAMSGLLYRFVRNYTDVFTGLFVVTLSMVSGSFSFAYYARPYALVLAADALALICWAKLVSDRQKRALALVGLFLGITIAVGSHWFGFLVLAPLAFAEALKTAQERRIDAPRSGQIPSAAVERSSR